MFNLIEKENLVSTIEELRKQGKTIVTTNGCFDLLHVGHVRYLQKTKTFADVCIVMLNSDASVKRLKGERPPPITVPNLVFLSTTRLSSKLNPPHGILLLIKIPPIKTWGGA